MPHAALDFEAALVFVESMPSALAWECRYVALLWLSVLVLVREKGRRRQSPMRRRAAADPVRDAPVAV